MQRLAAVLTTVVLALGGATATSMAADAATPGSGADLGALPASRTVPSSKANALALLRGLPVRREAHTASYERARFKAWVDADRDGENTRAEVLKAESRISSSVNRYGTVKGGRWISAYDNRVVTKAARLDVDHLVPLAEAWRSGAWRWSAKKREAFGNDLGYSPSLIAVTLSSNRSKGDADPAEWMPTASAYACVYVKHWIAVKARWRLSIDAAERTALTTHLASCSTYAVAKPGTPRIAALVTRAKPVAQPKPVAKPVAAPSSRYYANCTAVRAAGAAPLYRGQPGYETPRLDRDGDGVACE